MRSLIDNEELMAIHRAEGPEQLRLFCRWLETKGRALMFGTLRSVVQKRKMHAVMTDRAFVDDAISAASFVAWEHIVGYRWFCPVCRTNRVRRDGHVYGSKLSRNFDSQAALDDHGVDEHGAKAVAPPIGRRVTYMIGVRMQVEVRSKLRYIKRHAVTDTPQIEASCSKWDCDTDYLTAIPRWTGVVEVEDASAIDRLAALEERIDLERRAAALKSKDRLQARLLLAGVDATTCKRVCSEVLKAKRRGPTSARRN